MTVHSIDYIANLKNECLLEVDALAARDRTAEEHSPIVQFGAECKGPIMETDLQRFRFRGHPAHPTLSAIEKITIGYLPVAAQASFDPDTRVVLQNEPAVRFDTT